jgi:hypothetical protein
VVCWFRVLQSVVVLLSFIPVVASRQLTSGSKLLHSLSVVNSVGVNTLGLGNEEPGHDGTSKFAGEEDPEDLWDTDLAGKVVEEDTGENGTELADGGRETVSQTADTGWEDFAGDDEGAVVVC